MTQKQIKIIEKVKSEVKKSLKNDSTGHDYWHAERVRKMARRIVETEKVKVNLFVVELASLLHDIADWKFYEGDLEVGPKKAKKMLSRYKVEKKVVDHVVKIIKNISFKGAGVLNTMRTLEGKIVQDADKLDAIGAIGIARIFAFGGKMNFPIHDPNIKLTFHKTFEEYKTKSTTTINHFYEKLLLLRDRMNTKTGREIAEKRHKFLKRYLDRFLEEWEGKN
ncbi:MAG: HD domain-containing protein [Patescibacteria group bacterium]|nr:HD domain-containing protein [Patescibacteria group bacterium]